jgi:hypothetical protein
VGKSGEHETFGNHLVRLHAVDLQQVEGGMTVPYAILNNRTAKWTSNNLQ